MPECEGCARIARAGRGEDPACIREFTHSFLFLGDHQTFEGYSVLMLKPHVRELHDMEPGDYARLMEELRLASSAIAKAFQPWKMNHASLGNQLQHLHWHVMPRYEADPDRFQNPWYKMSEFSKQVPEPARRDALIARIRSAF